MTYVGIFSPNLKSYAVQTVHGSIALSRLSAKTTPPWLQRVKKSGKHTAPIVLPLSRRPPISDRTILRASGNTCRYFPVLSVSTKASLCALILPPLFGTAVCSNIRAKQRQRSFIICLLTAGTYNRKVRKFCVFPFFHYKRVTPKLIFTHLYAQIEW